MKKGTAILAAILMGASVTAALPGCAPTPTSRSAGTVVDDATITARVKTQLAKDPVAKATQINVETYRGVVQLSGFADSRQGARRAVEIAEDVPGVVDVRNDIRITPGS